MIQSRYSIFGTMILLLGCTEEPKKEKPQLDQIENHAGEGSALPFLFSNDKQTFLSWVAPVSDTLMALSFSTWNEDQWSPPEEIIRDRDWFVNWADFPALVENKGNLLTHLLKKSSSGTYSYDIKLNLRQKGGGSWQTDLPLHSDNTPTEHGFVTTLPYKDGFFVTWLDGRNTIENGKGERGAMTIRAAEVSIDGTINNEMMLDARTCDCCQTTAAITSNGPVVIYRDRSDDEVRDISIVRHVAGEWTSPKSIHEDRWQLKGCPVNGPKAAVQGNHLAIAWFTGANALPMVNLIFSKDGGATFGKPIRVDEANAMGRVDLLLLNENLAIVSWMETNNKQAELKALRINRDGTKGQTKLIAQMDASRKTGFPQMELVGDAVFFAWTNVDGDFSTVRTARMAVAHF